MNIRKALQYDSKNNAGLDDFIHKLPMHLRLEVSEEIHRDNFMRFDLFKRIGNKSFLAWVSSRMKMQLVSASASIYQKGDLIDNFFFCIRGVAAFVMSDLNNELIQVIDPIIYLARRKKQTNISRFPVLQYFGAEDLVVNVAAIVHDEARTESDFSFFKNGFRVKNRRYFSV